MTTQVHVPWRSTGQWRDLQIWLLDNVHTGSYRFLGCITHMDLSLRTVEFTNKQDAVLFALKWS